MPRKLPTQLKKWGDAVKQVSKQMKISVPIKKGTKEYMAVKKIYDKK